MFQSANDMIAALDVFVAKGDGRDEQSLGDILERFDESPERGRIVPAIFAVMERHPEADLGSPGPLVHCVESLPVGDFVSFLRASIQSQPGQLNVWMVNRILNSPSHVEHRMALLAALRAVSHHPRASTTVKAMAQRFLTKQA
ncbi:MAG: hypothetical protein JWN40_5551 [Phycisphaerales bacterium]|nr:hypothetical protein [Phycisphaerales bacterium]